MKPEPPFVHVADAGAGASESRFAALYKTEPRITGSPTLLVSDYITRNLAVSWRSRAACADQLDALTILADAPTARARTRLRRARRPAAATATTPGCSASSNYQLQQMRAARRTRATAGAGVYLGAYAWVEDLRPSRRGWRRCSCPPTSRQTSPAPRRSCTTRRMAATSTRRRSPTPAPPRCCAAAISRTRRPANPRDAGGQPVVRPGAARAVAARRHPQRPEPRRAARLPVRARAARRLRPGRGGQVHLPAAQGVSAGRRLARDDARRRPTCRSRRSRRATSSTAASWSRRSPPAACATYPFGLTDAARRHRRRSRGDQRRRRTRCSTSTTRSPISRWPRACTRRCRATSTGSAPPSTPIRRGNFPPEPRGRADAARRHRADPPRRACISGRASPRPPGATPRAQAEPALDAWLGEPAAAARPDRLRGHLDRSGRRGPQQPASRSPILALRPIDLLALIKPDARAGDDRARRPHPALRRSRPPRRAPTRR